MNEALWLLFAQGVLGASDTLYYHEVRARLPGLGPLAAPELRLHAARDFIYAIVFASLPWIEWRGSFAAVLALLLAAEIGITLADFVIEDRVRKPLGGVYPGERAMHAVMGIVYGAMLSHLLPVLVVWWRAPTAIVLAPANVPPTLRWVLVTMAAGVFGSGLRDLGAAAGIRLARWPHPLPNSASEASSRSA
jgi:hypothetical protein